VGSWLRFTWRRVKMCSCHVVYSIQQTAQNKDNRSIWGLVNRPNILHVVTGNSHGLSSKMCSYVVTEKANQGKPFKEKAQTNKQPLSLAQGFTWYYF
jgi:hypothetical protein